VKRATFTREVEGGFPLCVLSLPEKAYAVKVYLVPAVFTTNSFGISLLKATIALNPVQWVPTI
jgi:hypothetical protein